MQRIRIPKNIKCLNPRLFFFCKSLKKIELPYGLKTIKESAFDRCFSLSSIALPESTISIGDYAFNNCRNLTEISLPDSLKVLGKSVFHRCHNMMDIYVSPDNSFYASIAGVLFNKREKALICYPSSKQQEEYVIPNGIKIIRSDAFHGCFNLRKITLPESVISIERYAFSFCTGITEMILPNGLKLIEENAFAYCEQLTSIVIPDSVQSIGAFAFSGCPALILTVGRTSYARDYWAPQVHTQQHAAMAGAFKILFFAFFSN